MKLFFDNGMFFQGPENIKNFSERNGLVGYLYFVDVAVRLGLAERLC
jgi:hypothetical protein